RPTTCAGPALAWRVGHVSLSHVAPHERAACIPLSPVSACGRAAARKFRVECVVKWRAARRIRASRDQVSYRSQESTCRCIHRTVTRQAFPVAESRSHIAAMETPTITAAEQLAATIV